RSWRKSGARVHKKLPRKHPGSALAVCQVEPSTAISSVAVTLETKAVASPEPLSNALIGTWKLLSREDRTHAGERRHEPSLGANPVALLFFDRRGHFSTPPPRT